MDLHVRILSNKPIWNMETEEAPSAEKHRQRDVWQEFSAFSKFNNW